MSISITSFVAIVQPLPDMTYMFALFKRQLGRAAVRSRAVVLLCLIHCILLLPLCVRVVFGP